MSVSKGSNAEYDALIDLSARLGREPLLVQAAGGNTSIKRDGILWVKASGTWLAQAARRDIMVPVRLEPLLAALDTEAVERAEDYVATNLNPSGLRPSIEATLHAALPQRVVLHVHCVDTIAWAVQAECVRLIAPLLDGLAWRFIPYVRPGPPLTRAIVAAGPADVLVLGNHGLVVAAETVASAEALLREVTRRLRRSVRAAPAGNPARLDGDATYCAAPDEAHAVATDPVSAALAARGTYYPDHAIFLGPGLSGVRLVPGAGMLLRRDAPHGAAALARCLADVIARLSPDDDLRVLTGAQERELVDWEAEAYRRKLAASAA